MAPHTIEVTTTISASPSHIYAILTDFPSYPAWSRYITALTPVSNPAAPPGTKLLVTLDGRVLNETVIQNDESGFGWGGQIITPGVFAAKNLILIGRQEEGGTSVTMKGEFRGVLFGVMRWMGMEEQGRKGMQDFAESLKERCEKR